MNIQQPKKPNHKKWLIVLAVLIILAVLGYTNKRYLQLQYTNIKQNPFSVNDNIYAGKYALALYPESGVPLGRLAKINKGDGSVMVVSSGIRFTTKSITKPKHVLLGKYLGHEIHKVEFPDGIDLENFYIIEVNPALVKKADTPESKVKHDYTYLNDKYYVQSFWVTNKQ